MIISKERNKALYYGDQITRTSHDSNAIGFFSWLDHHNTFSNVNAALNHTVTLSKDRQKEAYSGREVTR